MSSKSSTSSSSFAHAAVEQIPLVKELVRQFYDDNEAFSLGCFFILETIQKYENILYTHSGNSHGSHNDLVIMITIFC